MGRRLQTRRHTREQRALARLTLAFLGVFTIVIVALSAVAFGAIAANYRSIVAPVLDTAEGRSGLAAALRPALAAILAADAALIVAVGAASYALSRLALRPLLEAQDREERFTGDVAHELRTPLGAIVAIAQAARASATGAERDAFEAIGRRALDLGTLAGDLLTLARARDAGSLDLEPVDLGMLARHVVADAAAVPGAVAIDCSAASAIVLGDELRLGQLVRNLTDNARTHARTRVRVEVATLGNRAVVTVEDDGPGVEPALVPRLFERFARGSTSTGSGLGLATCRWIADAHGGEIAYAGGSTFVVRLPLSSRA